MIEITTNNFNETVSKLNTVVDVWAPWCGPCLMVAPILEQLSTENNNVQFAKCNIDEHPEIAKQFGIRNIPAILFFKDGKLISTQIGAVSKKIYENKLKELYI
jgi:thioredoxin 1